jgi:pyrophosphatase PpaX
MWNPASPSTEACVSAGMRASVTTDRKLMFNDATAVLFDLDGTLVDTVELILAAHTYALGRYLRGPVPTRAAIIRNLGRPLREALGEFVEADGAADPAAVMPPLIEAYRSFQSAHHDRLVRPIDGARETLVMLRDRGYQVGVVTSKIEETARVSIDFCHLAGLFAVEIYLHDTSRHKPLPDPLLEAARRGGFNPQQAVYVGDSVHDIAAGRAAGMKTVGVLWGPFDRRELEAAGPDALIDSPRDLLALLPIAPSSQLPV